MSEPLARRSLADVVLAILTVLALITALLSGINGRVATATGGYPTFSKAFSPDTIGPGSSTTLTFTIDNSANFDPADELAFTDTMPSAIEVAAVPGVANTCGGTVTAVAGSSTISLADGQVGAGETCAISVNAVGTTSSGSPFTNLTGDLTSSLGNSGTATDDLTVSDSLIGFTKAFDPASITVGATSTLTFSLDNGGGLLTFLTFNDTLPTGMVVAPIPNATTSCGGGVGAVSGTSVISFSAGTLFGESSCEVNVDVMADSGGTFDNVSGLLTHGSGTAIPNGFATASLDVPIDSLNKVFLDDPVVPGGSVTLQFTVLNPSRTDTATGLTFTDDLDAALTDLVATGLPASACGGTVSTPDAGATIEFSGGTLPVEGSCTFEVVLDVPADATPGTHTNTTSTLEATIGGEPFESEEGATDELTIEFFPILTKEFTDDPVGAGSTVTLEFTITNADPDNGLDDIEFVDELTAGTTSIGPTDGFLPFPVTIASPTLPTAACGGTLALVSPAEERQGLELTGGSLAEAGMAGDSCTFSVDITIPPGLAAGTYTNTTGPITGDNCGEGCIVTGPPASDDLVVVGAPSLTKTFLEDSVLPGGTATLQFTVSHDPLAGADASGITFTDDLASVASGLTVSLPSTPNPACGSGSSLTGSVGDTLLTFTGAALSPGEECTFTVDIDVDSGADLGVHTNTTSLIDATVGGVAVSGPAAEGELIISPFIFTKEFTPNPVEPGDPVTLEFTITLDSSSPTSATSIIFRDNLDSTLDGLTANLPTDPDPPCGDDSEVTLSSGDTFITLTDGDLDPGDTCTFSLDLDVPSGAPLGTYQNATQLDPEVVGGISGIIDGGFRTGPAATDELTVDLPLPPLLTKEFADGTVELGGMVELEFTLTNPNAVETLFDVSFTDDLAAVMDGLTANLPTDPTPPCGVDSSVVLSASDTLITFTGGELGPMASCTFSLDLDVDVTAHPGSYPNVTSDPTGDRTDESTLIGEPATDTLDVVTELVEADLSITKTDSPDPVDLEGTLTYSVDVANAGPDDAERVVVVDTLPAGVTFVSATGDLCAEAAGVLTCAVTELLTASSSASFDVTVTVDAGTFGRLTNTATVSSDTSDPDGSNNTATTSTLAGPLDLEKATNGVDADEPEDAPEIDITDPVTWSYVVTNVGDEPLFEIAVTDNVLGAISCPDDRLSAGLSMTCSASGFAEFGLYANTGTVTGATAADVAVGDSDDSHYVGVLLDGFGVDIKKTPGFQLIPIGGTANWTITVTNTGTSMVGMAPFVVSFTVDDPLAPDCDASLGALDPGESASYTCELTDVSASFGNTATVSGTVDAEEVATDSDTAEVIAENGEIDITKAPATQSILPGGSTASWDITVTNTGRLDLTGVEVSDPLAPDCDNTVGALAAGDSASYSCSLAGVTASFTNVATVEGFDGESTVTGSTTAQVVVLESGLDIDKTPDEQTINPGATANFTITVRNSGATTLTGVSVSDPAAPDCDADIGALTPGAEVSYDCSLDDVADPFVNTAMATASGPGPEVIEVSDDATVNVLASSITVDKLPNFQAVAEGGTAEFEIIVTNSGRGDLTDVVVSDPLAPDCDTTIPELLEGEVVSYECTLAGVTESFVNVATATADDDSGEPLSDDDDALVAVPRDLEIIKSPDSQVIVTGGAANFTITVINSGDTALSDVEVTDALSPDCDADIGPLAPDTAVSYDCSLSGIDADFTNVATVSGLDGAVPLADSDDAFVEVDDPTLEIEKSPDVQTVAIGGTANWTITVTNTSRVDLVDVEVSDPLAPDCDRVIGGLAAGALFAYSCSLGPVASDFTNVATVSGSAGATTVDDVDSAEVVVAAIEITKTPDTQTIDSGATANFTIRVVNTGTEVVSGIVVSDPAAPDCDAAVGTLGPGDFFFYDCELTGVTESFVNTASVSGDPDGGESAFFDEDTAEVIVRVGGIDIQKDPATQRIDPGETATFTITVANTGRDPLTDVTVSDPLAPDCDRAIGTLADGESATYSCTLAGVTLGFVNTATVTATDATETLSDDDDAEVVVRGISITKTPLEQSVAHGASATWVITVLNTSDEPLTDVAVADPLAPDCAQALGDLTPEASVAYSCTLAGVTADFTNIATATGETSTTTVTSVAAADVLVIPEADVSISKTDGLTSAIPGESLTYTIVVTNPGPFDDPVVSLTDTFPAGLTCTFTSVAAGGATGNTAVGSGNITETLSMPAGSSVTYAATCSIDAAATGSLSNTAAATGSFDPDSLNNSATDSDTVLNPQADLTVTKTDGAATVAAGGTLVYTVSLTNNGPSDALNVVGTETVPAGTTFVKTTGCAEGVGGVPTCSLGTIAAGATKAYTVEVKVGEFLNGGTVLTNTATAASTTPLLNTGDDTATDSTTVTPGVPEVGRFNPDNGLWTMQLRNGTIINFTFGDPGDMGVLGDWDGDGHRTPGVYRPSDITFYGRNSNSSGPADFSFKVGEAGDKPVSGDWNGDGKDSLALYRPSTQQFFVFDDFANKGVDHTLTFGEAGDMPFSGDIDNDGDDDAAVQRPDGPLAGRMFFRTSLTTGPANVIFTYGNAGDRPFFGDWNHDGTPTIGVYRPAGANSAFYLRNSNTVGPADIVVTLPGATGTESPAAGPL